MSQTRDAERTRWEILRTGFNEVYERGFRATSVNDIVAKTNVTKGAFFHYFPTKNDLGYAIVDEVLGEMMLQRWIRPIAAYRNPIQGMITRYRKLMEETSDVGLALGCPLNNLSQEMSPVDPVFREKLRGVLDVWIEGTEMNRRRAQAQGYLRPDENPRKIAEFVVMLEEGSAAMMKNMRDRKIYWSLYEGFRQYLESVSVKSEASPA